MPPPHPTPPAPFPQVAVRILLGRAARGSAAARRSRARGGCGQAAGDHQWAVFPRRIFSSFESALSTAIPVSSVLSPLLALFTVCHRRHT